MPTVNLRVWAAGQTSQAQPADRLGAIIADVARIWGNVGVTLVPEATLRDVHLKQPVAAAPGEQPIDLAVTVPAELAAVINPAIVEKREGWVDVVFVPAFGHWGQAYSPLIQLSPGKRNSFAPFTGPVVILATRAAQRPAQPETTRANAATPRDATQTAEQLLEIALANDIAHELGHVFGLWHTSDVNRPGAPEVKQAVRDAAPDLQDALCRSGQSGKPDPGRRSGRDQRPPRRTNRPDGGCGRGVVHRPARRSR
jgi:hypothetical protein